LCAGDRAGWAIERCEEAITRRVDLSAAKAHELRPNCLVVLRERFGPGAISELDGACRRVCR
jgi:hypothetical protein